MFDDREGGVPQDPKNTKKKALRKRALLNSGLLLKKNYSTNYRFICKSASFAASTYWKIPVNPSTKSL